MHATRTLTLLIACAVAAAATSARPAVGQLQSKHQIKCLNELNKSAALVAQAQGDDDYSCVKASGKEDLGMSALQCLSADLQSKVAKRQQRTVEVGESKCSIEQPTFGATDAETVNTGASAGQIDLALDLFGSDVDTALVTCSADSAGCKCQARVTRAAGRLAYARIKAYADCAKRAILVNKLPFLSGAVSAADLEMCLTDAATPWSVAADEQGKIADASAKLEAAVLSCPAGNYFPGECAASSGSGLADCLAERADCRACLAINEIFALAAACSACDSAPPPTE